MNKPQGTQILRKATIQSTFKHLQEVEKKILDSRVGSDEESAPKMMNLVDLEEAATRQKFPYWVVEPALLARGELVEVEVELEADPTFRLSAVIGTMAELVQENSGFLPTVDAGELNRAIGLNQILEKFMVGLIPLRCRAVKYVVANVEGRDIVLHVAALARMPQSARPDVRPLYISGVTEERLYWKDIRRVLFSGSRFLMLCRIGRSGLATSWTPVKLVEVLSSAVPNLGVQLGDFGDNALRANASAGVSSDSERRDQLRRDALRRFGRMLMEGTGARLETIDDRAIESVAMRTDVSFDTIDGLREAFSEVRREVEISQSISLDPDLVADARAQALIESGLTSEGVLSPVRDDRSAPQQSTMAILDTEIVAIYW